MLLSSALEPAGPKSTSHYLVLHHGDRRDLVELPRSFSDLKQLVEKLFHIDPDRFHIETEDLNLCVGKRVRIPKDVWGTIAELLGNVHILPYAVDDPNPESGPEPRIQTARPLGTKQESAEAAVKLDQNKLYQQILNCDPSVPSALVTIRKESNMGNVSDVKWRGHKFPPKVWNDFQWGLQPRSVLVVRYNLPKDGTGQWSICFGPNTTRYSLDITMYSTGNINFWAHDDKGDFKRYHTLSLKRPMHLAGDHSVALINHNGAVHVYFDFVQSTVLPMTTLIDRELKKLKVEIPLPKPAEVDVYELGQ